MGVVTEKDADGPPAGILVPRATKTTSSRRTTKSSPEVERGVQTKSRRTNRRLNPERTESEVALSSRKSTVVAESSESIPDDFEQR